MKIEFDIEIVEIQKEEPVESIEAIGFFEGEIFSTGPVSYVRV